MAHTFPWHDWSRSFGARLLLGALLIRVLYLLSILDNPFFHHPITDEAFYDEWARALLAGKDLTNGYPYFDPPLHAYFLALIYGVFGPHYLAVRAVQVVLGTLNVGLLYGTATRLFGPVPARVVGVLAALYLPFLYYEGLLLKESLALFLLTLFVFLLVRTQSHPSWHTCLGAGMILGLLALTRVNALALLPASLVVFWLHGRTRLTPALVFVLGLVLVIAPVTVRNYLVSGDVVLISAYGGQVLYNANNPANTSGDYKAVPGVRPNPQFERIDFHRRAEEATGRTMTPSEVSRYWGQRSLEFALAHPWTQAKMVGWRLLRFWNYVEMPDNHSYEQFKRFSWLLNLPLPGFWLVGPLALIGMVLLRFRWRELAVLYLVVGAYAVSLLPFWIFSRYRLPIVGVLILFAGPALVQLVPMLRASWHAGRTAFATRALGALAAAVLCWLPLGAPSLATNERNLAFAYEESGRYDKAIAIYARLRQQEQNPHNELFLANALGAAGRTSEAVGLLQELTMPAQPPEVRRQAFNFLGDLGRRRQQWRRAEAAYRAALALDPRDYGAWNNLAVTLAAQSRFEDAQDALRRSIELAPFDELARRNLAALEAHLARSRPTPTGATPAQHERP